MSTRPVLGDWTIPHVETIYTSENRAYAEFAVPGRSGSLYQDLNSRPINVVITGSLYGDDIRNEFLETVREKFQQGQPVTFTADILSATELQYVVIESMKFRESGRRAGETDFLIVLLESPPPPPPANPLGALDAGLLDQAGGLLDSVTGALDVLDALGNVPDIGNPTEPLTQVASDVSDALSGVGDALAPLQAIFGSDDD